MVAAMLSDSDSDVASDCFYRPSTRAPVSSLRRFGQAGRLLASEAPRSGLAVSECCSGESLVLRDIDRPFAMPRPSVAKLLHAVFGLARMLHFVALSSRQLSADHSRTAPERP